MADRQPPSELADHPSGGPFSADAGNPSSPGSLHSTLSGSPSPPRPSSTPGSATARSPQKGGAYWFASAGEDAGDHSHCNAHDYNPKECYWFAHAAEMPSRSCVVDEQKTAEEDDDFDLDADGREQLDREERLRLLRERQSEERQRRIDDIKVASLHAQKVREEQEEKRRLKIEELKTRDQERRAMVEERKRQIWEAEKERKEAILKKNMQREARIEALRNANRSSIGFAFGSSTPRLLDGEPGFFSTRRATSQSNMTTLSSSGRGSAERELGSGKKRTTSSFVSSHRAGDAGSSSSASNDVHELSAGPPEPWNGLEDMSSSFSSASGRLEMFPFYRSNRFFGNLTGSGVFVGEDLMTKSCSALMSGPLPNRGRRKTDLIPTIPAHDSPRTQSPATRTTPSSPSRPNSSMSQQSLSSHASQSSTVSMRNRMTPRRPRPVSIAGTPTAEVNRVTADERLGRSTERRSTTPSGKPPRAKSAGADHILPDAGLSAAKPAPPKASAKAPTKSTPAAAPKSAVDKPKIPPKPARVMQRVEAQSPSAEVAKPIAPCEVPTTGESAKLAAPSAPAEPVVVNGEAREKSVEPLPAKPPGEVVSNGVDAHEASQEEGSAPASKTRITTEEEAKAAMAERRRLAREQAEREAELERQRQEELKRQELERIRLEEEERQRWECEQDVLRKAEEERLQRAIEEQRVKEEEERKRKDEEAKQKQEKEEADRKAREEQEKLRKETEERLRREEEERAERRKRVEAIMSRTRNKGTNNTPVTTPTKAEDAISEKFVEKTPGGAAQTTDAPSDAPVAQEAEPVPIAKDAEALGDAPDAGNVPTEVENRSLQDDDPSQEQTEDDDDDDDDDDKEEPQQTQQLIDFSGNETSVELIDHSPSLFNNSQPQKTEALLDLPHLMGDVIPLHTNGFGEKENRDFVVGSKSCETKTNATNLLDAYAEFDLLKSRASPSMPAQPLVEFDQIIDLGLTTSGTGTATTEDFLNNADNVNSNLPANGPGAPFLAFEDNFVQKQETNISDL